MMSIITFYITLYIKMTVGPLNPIKYDANQYSNLLKTGCKHQALRKA